MKKDALVGNCADPEQVKQAEKKVKNRRDTELEDIRFLLSDRRARNFIWRLLTHCRVFESIWEPSAKIHHNAGRQDVGHFIMAEVVEAREDALLEMMREAKGE